jgi:hypothetical protein
MTLTVVLYVSAFANEEVLIEGQSIMINMSSLALSSVAKGKF